MGIRWPWRRNTEQTEREAAEHQVDEHQAAVDRILKRDVEPVSPGTALGGVDSPTAIWPIVTRGEEERGGFPNRGRW